MGLGFLMGGTGWSHQPWKNGRCGEVRRVKWRSACRRTVVLAASGSEDSDGSKRNPWRQQTAPDRSASTRLASWRRAGRIPDVVEVGKVLRELASEGDLEGVEEGLALMKQLNVKPNAFIVLEAMRAHLHERNGGDFQAAHRVLLEARKSHITVNIRLYNLLFTHLGKVGQVDELDPLRRELEEFGLEPDHVTYTTMITGLGKRKKVRRAEALFEEMQKRLVPTEKTYGAMLDMYAGAHQMNKAERIFRLYCKNYKPSIRLFTRMINAYSHSGDRKKAMDCFQMMKRYGLEPNQVTYNALLRSETRFGSVKSAGTVLRAMLKRGEKPDTFTFAALIDAFGREGNTAKALDIFILMKEAGEIPTTKSYNTVLTACLRNGEMKQAAAAFEDMKQFGAKPDIVTYNIFIGAFGKMGDLGRMWKVYELLGREGIKPDEHTFTQMIASFVRHGRPAVAAELYQQSIKLPLRATTLSNEYLKALIEKDLHDQAWDVLRIMQENRVHRNGLSFELRQTLRKHYADQKKSPPGANVESNTGVKKFAREGEEASDEALDDESQQKNNSIQGATQAVEYVEEDEDADGGRDNAGEFESAEEQAGSGSEDEAEGETTVDENDRVAEVGIEGERGQASTE